MPDEMLVRMLFSLALVIGLLLALAWAIKQYGSRLGLSLPVKKGKSRVQLMDVVPLDARHRLVLVRRDDTEHLLVMGGAQPVVIEAGIKNAVSGNSESMK